VFTFGLLEQPFVADRNDGVVGHFVGVGSHRDSFDRHVDARSAACVRAKIEDDAEGTGARLARRPLGPRRRAVH